MDVPRSWMQLAVERLRGTILVIGAPDVGKTTLAQYLYERLSDALRCVAYLDGDPGQSMLGPPATMTVVVRVGCQDAFPPRECRWQRFVGAVSPRGHMLPLLVNAARLVGAARGAGAEAIVYDTTGLVDVAQGGLALKLAKVDLLQPTTVVAIQREQELEPILQPLRRSARVRVIDLRPAPSVQRRPVRARQAHRTRQFAAYLCPEGVREQHLLEVDWSRLAVLPDIQFLPGRLVAMEDVHGFLLGLGVVTQSVAQSKIVTLYTPLRSLEGVDALRLGDVRVDTHTFVDQQLGPHQGASPISARLNGWTRA